MKVATLEFDIESTDTTHVYKLNGALKPDMHMIVIDGELTLTFPTGKELADFMVDLLAEVKEAGINVENLLPA